jgi:hypothetical protein
VTSLRQAPWQPQDDSIYERSKVDATDRFLIICTASTHPSTATAPATLSLSVHIEFDGVGILDDPFRRDGLPLDTTDAELDHILATDLLPKVYGWMYGYMRALQADFLRFGQILLGTEVPHAEVS